MNDAITLLNSLYESGDLSVDQHAGIMRGFQALETELSLLRELAEDFTRWREAGGDIRDLTYVFETMDRYQATKAGEQ